MKKFIFVLILLLVAAGGGVATALLLSPKSHELVYYEAVEPTCELPGYMDYYYCKECNKYYDKLKKEVSKKELILPALGHAYQFESFEWIEGNDEFCIANLICSNDPSHTSVQYVFLEKQITPATIKTVEVTKLIATYDDHTEEKIIYGKSVVPEFSVENGFYDNAFSLKIYTNLEDVAIYYTTDGSTPTEQSTLYTGSVDITDNSQNVNIAGGHRNTSALDVYYPEYLLDKCTILKAIAVDGEGNKSKVSQAIYFVGYNEKQGYDNLPIISISLNDDDLFGYENGIYVKGQIYDSEEYMDLEPAQRPTNYSQQGKEWEREAYFAYFDTQKEIVVSQKIGLRIHNDGTQAQNQKSFDLFAREEYSGSNYFDKALLGDYKTSNYVLRSGGNIDTAKTKLRDMTNQDFAKSMDMFDSQNSESCIVFLNGEYWGVYNLQESYTNEYFEEKYGISKDNIVTVTNNQVDSEAEEDILLFSQLTEFFTENQFTEEEQYILAADYINLHEFASYMAYQIYIGNIDWPANNVKMWRSKTVGDNIKEDGKWHFMLQNLDNSCAVNDMCTANSDPFSEDSHLANGPLDRNCILGLMFSKLMQNEEFKQLFKHAIAQLGTEIFTAEAVQEYLAEKVELLQDSMPFHYKRFVSADGSTYNKQYFLDEVEAIKTFFASRYQNMLTFIELHFPV